MQVELVGLIVTMTGLYLGIMTFTISASPLMFSIPACFTRSAEIHYYLY